MNKKILFAIFAATNLAAIAPSYAQWYVGASAGQADIKSDSAALADQFLDLGFESAVTSTKKRDTGYRLFGGYQIHRYIAAELSYVDLGKFSSSTKVTPAGSLDSKTSIKGGEISIVGTLPVNDSLGIFVRAGALAAETKTTYVGTGSIITVSGGEEQKQKSTQLSYGAGAHFNINKQFAVRGEWARYTKLGSELTGGKTDANLYSIGLLYRF